MLSPGKRNCAVTSLGLHTFCLATEPLPNSMYNSYVLPAFSSKLAPVWVSFLHTVTDFHKTWYSLRISSFKFKWEIQKGSKLMEEWKEKVEQTNLSRTLIFLESESNNKYLRIILLIMWQFTSSVKCQATVWVVWGFLIDSKIRLLNPFLRTMMSNPAFNTARI